MDSVMWTRQALASDLRYLLPYLGFAASMVLFTGVGVLIGYFIGKHRGEMRSPMLHEQEWLQLQLTSKTTAAELAGANRVAANQAMVIDRLMEARRPVLISKPEQSARVLKLTLPQ